MLAQVRAAKTRLALADYPVEPLLIVSESITGTTSYTERLESSPTSTMQKIRSYLVTAVGTGGCRAKGTRPTAAAWLPAATMSISYV